MPAKPQVLHLALQGGGAHGAFTWGVLNRLLEDESLEIGDVSGTSAGALNGLVLVSGLAAGGRAEAARRLEQLWWSVAGLGSAASWLMWPLRKPGAGLWDDFAPILAPRQMNPLGMQPLAAILQAVVTDIEAVRSAPSRLHVNAVDVLSGHGRIFGPEEMSIQAVLASACAPMLFSAIELDGRPYWDGSYAANPSLQPLYTPPQDRDLLLVELAPRHRTWAPVTALNILDRINEIASVAALRAELEAIQAQNRLHRGKVTRCHSIQLEHSDARVDDPSAKRSASWDLLMTLRASGHAACEAWLAAHRDDIGQRSTLDFDLYGPGDARAPVPRD